MSLSTHVLDTALGRPVPNLAITLDHRDASAWQLICHTVTNIDGRTSAFPRELNPGIYRLHFDTAAHFERQGVAALHPFVEIAFTVTDPLTHLHVPLLLTANGYTTYRGS